MKKIRQSFIAILSVMVLSISGAHAAADGHTGANTDYTTAETNSWINMGPAMEPLNLSSFLVCIIKATGANLIVNGTYKALIDTSKCQTGSVTSKPEFAKVTVITSRADNSSPQYVKVWFDTGSAQSGQYMAEATVTKGVSSTEPYGAFTFSWINKNDSTEKGTMSFTPDSTSTTIKMYAAAPVNQGGTSWINGLVNNDRVSGSVAVGTFVGNGNAATYAVSFNSTNVNVQKGAAAAVCSDRSSFSEFVFGYNLYSKITGDEKVLSGPFQCTYTSAANSNATMQCYMGPYGGWFEGGDSGVTSVTHKNGTLYTGITYDPTDSGANGNTANDGLFVNVPNYTFSPPIIFPKASQSAGVQTSMGSNNRLKYFGGGSLNGLPWTCRVNGTFIANDGAGSCDSATAWRPAAGLADGTTLTDANSTDYVVKAKWSAKVMDSVAANNCSSLDLSGVTGTYTALTTADLIAVSIGWADKPTVSGAPTVIDGVKQ